MMAPDDDESQRAGAPRWRAWPAWSRSATASTPTPSWRMRRSGPLPGSRNTSPTRASPSKPASMTSPPLSSPRAGSGPLHVAICAEYDALPGIGHACGHNLIAAMAAGAGVAAARVADDAGLTVTVIGCPAEEAGNAGGKILLLERGAFDSAHVAMMVHPAPVDILLPKMIAATMFEARYTGKEAHASAFPELGINAADALTIAQTAIGLLRQSIRSTDRIHGIITHGGDAPNVIPGAHCRQLHRPLRDAR